MCDIVGCDEESEFVDETEDKFCSDCMENELREDEDLRPEDFEPIKKEE